MADNLGIEAQIVWGTFFIDLREIAGFGEYVINGVADPSITEIVLKNIGGRIINIPLKDFEIIMEKVWGKFK